MTTSAWSAFQQAGFTAASDHSPQDGDWLPLVAAGAKTAKQRTAWETWRRQGAQLLWGPSMSRWPDWLGPRWVWWPRGVPAGCWTAAASSRLVEPLEQHRAWFAALRTLAASLQPSDCWLAAESSACGRFAIRAAEHSHATCLRIKTPSRKTRLDANWSRKILHAAPVSPLHFQAWLSPPIAPHPGDSLPLADRVLAAWSRRLTVLQVRPGGHWEQLLTRLSSSERPPGSLRLLLDEGLTPRDLADRFLQQGVLGWRLLSSPSPASPKPSVAAVSSVLSSPPFSQPYLTHCTRRCRGPWPRQREEDYLDDLLLDRPSGEHSPLAALRRIAQTGRLIASSGVVRGKTPVVSFTAAPLEQLPEMRVFRGHRGHWDFEPYGVCVDRRWLIEQGSQPVRYGDETMWESLSEAERRFFHQRTTRPSLNGKMIDWTSEQEWRAVGDVELSKAPPGGVLFFAPNRREAEALAAICPWPVLDLERLSKSAAAR